MDPFIAGSLISAGSSLLGVIFSKNNVGKATRKELRARIVEGQRWGLHPLASIGAQTSGYQPVMQQAFTSAGQAIQQGMAARADASRDRDLMRKQEALIDEQILEARSRTALNLANAKRAAIGPGSTVDPFEPRAVNALMKVRLENGDVVWMPNPDVYEISPTELAAGRGILEASRAGGGLLSQPDTTPQFPQGAKLGDIFRPGNGFEYVYTKQGWRRRKERE